MAPFLPQSATSTKLDIKVYRCKDDIIRKGLLQTICLVIIKGMINFLTLNKPLLPSKFVTVSQMSLFTT